MVSTTKLIVEISLVSESWLLISKRLLISLWSPKDKLQPHKKIDLRERLNALKAQSIETKPKTEDFEEQNNAKRLEARRQNQQNISSAIKVALGLEARPKKIAKESKSKRESEKGKNVEAKEFLPRQKIFELSTESQFLQSCFDLPCVLEPPIPVSKLQSRLEQIRTSANKLESSLTEENKRKNDEIQCFEPQIDNKTTSSLPLDQQSALSQMSKLSPKYFQDAFDYFVSYHKDIQQTSLNFRLIESFLGAKGISIKRKFPEKVNF